MRRSLRARASARRAGRIPAEGIAESTVSRRAVLGAGAAVVALSGCSSAAPPRPSDTAATEPSTTAPSATVVPAHRAATSSPTVSPTVVPRGPARELARGSGRRPEVALTFHGAGDPALGRQVLAVLATERARVTVLAVGTWLAGQRSLASSIVAAGHELGNHTWSHPVLSELGRGAARAEIQRCRDLLISVTGSPGAHFRQSGGQHSTALIRELAGLAGYPVCLSYDIDSLDWTDPGPAAVRRNAAAASAGSIISLHLGHQGTFAALPAILHDLRSRGLRPVTATELLQP